MTKPIPICNYYQHCSKFALVCSSFIFDASLACLLGAKKLTNKHQDLKIYVVLNDDIAKDFNDKHYLKHSEFNKIRDQFGGIREFEITPEDRKDIINFFNNCKINKTKQLSQTTSKKIIYIGDKPNQVLFKNSSLEKVNKDTLKDSIINNDALITSSIDFALLTLFYEKELYWTGNKNELLNTFHEF
jgi:hypothetical protein